MPNLETNDKSLTIVIVADNADFRDFLSDCLSLTYTCFESGNGREGYGLISRIIPNIIISEVLMTKIGGFELCEKIKENITLCHIPIILLTEQNTPEHIVAGYENGADVCVSKPFKMNVLKAQISRLIKNRELIREKYILQNFMIEISSSNLTRNDEFMIQLRQVLEDNLSDFDFNVQKLSSKLNMSQTSLYRKIKILTGYSPVEFMLFFKMNKAYKLLSTSNSIKAIGYSLGFRHLSYFSRCFKNQFGVTPFTFRQKGMKYEGKYIHHYQANIA